jgi:hypothetical protein
VGYRWRYEDRTGSTVPGPQAEFSDQAEAEDWLGVSWQALLDDSIDQVTLVHGSDVVYGPMSLHPPDA